MSMTGGTPYTNREKKPKGRASSASDNKQNVRLVRNCRRSSVQTVGYYLSCLLNIGSDGGEQVTSACRVFHTRAAATGKTSLSLCLCLSLSVITAIFQVNLG